MSWLDRLGNTLWRRGAQHDLIAEEQAFHIELLTRENIALGMTPGAARAAALRRFGNPLLLREKTLAVDRLAGLEALVRDLRLAVRSLLLRRGRRGLAFTAVASLALGIGANSAVFSLVDAVLLRPLPLPHPERLIAVEESKNGEVSGSNPARLADWAGQVTAVAAAAGFYGEGLILTGRGDPVRLRAVRTVGRPLAVLGVPPLLGRSFTAEEDAGRGDRVVLVGESLWRRRFGADPHLMGKTLTLSGEPFAVVGVLADRTGFPEDWDVMAPAPPGVQQASRKAGFLGITVRLRPGVSLPGVQAELATVAGRLARQYPDSDAGRRARAVPLQEAQTGGVRLPFLVLQGTAGLVLLITCVNIAGLLLARAAERRREAAIRIALGAGRGGLLRLYLAESLVLAVAGGALGLLLAAVSLTALKDLLPADTPRLASAELDLRAVSFGAVLSLLCGLAFGLAPAWQAAGRSPGGSLREGGRAGVSRGSLRVRRALVAAQVTLSVAVLAGVGLLAKSLYRMQSAPLGARADHVLTVQIDFPWDTPPERLDGFTAQALEAFTAIPGVHAAGVVDRLPLEGESQSGPLAVDGVELPPELTEKRVGRRAASAGYFAAMGIPLRAGRLLRDGAGRTGGPREALINETLARLYFPDGRALGRRITFDVKPEAGEAPVWLEVAGIVGDVRRSADQAAPIPEVFVLPRDTYWPLARFALRTQGDPRSLAAAVRQAVHRIDPAQVIDGISTMDEQVGAATAAPRARVLLLGAFAAVALWLAVLGLYGVLSSDVAQRTHEIGVRLALGADRRRVLGSILWSGTSVALCGLLLGLAGAALLGRWLGALLFGVAPLDPPVLLAVGAVLLTVAAVAAYLPARRAAAVDPGAILRHE
jgi:putative ABC transport system permease protein